MKKTEFARLLILIILLIFLNPLWAQKYTKHGQSKLVSVVSFKTFSGGVIIIKLRMDDLPDSLSFLIDTGSSSVSFDSATSKHYDMLPETSDQVLVGIGGARNAKVLKNKTIRLGDLVADHVNLNVVDYSILSSVYGEKIDGILGNNFLSRFVVNIDYDSSKLFIYSKGHFRYPRGGFLFNPAMVGIPMQVTEVKDASAVTSRFYFDTGAGLCMLLSEEFVKDSSLLKSSKKILHTQAEGLGGTVDMRLTYLKEVKIGPYKFRRVPTYIFNDENNTMAYPNLSGLIGNDLLRRFNATLNYDAKEFYLVPNSHFSDPFDYSYTGLHIYWTESGQIVVADVMKNSPAEKAGLKPGDIIMALDNNFNGNIQTYTAILQNVGARINCIVKRNQKLEQLTLVVKSIF
ncbi:MAG: aspartyl protease family protein [Bacteroidetes bacterium]|nr:aspartyl protease family protein [Bacteroidota bacterium]